MADAPSWATRRSDAPSSGSSTRAPARGTGSYSGGTSATAQLVLAPSPEPHAAAVIGATEKPPSAMSMASRRQASSPSLPKRLLSSSQPATAPGTVTERGPRSATGSTASTTAGAGPAASRPTSSPPCQTQAKASPPRPVDIGSVTHRTAAAAMAASTALPPAANARSPACVARGWLVATIASLAYAGWRPKLERNADGADLADNGRGPPLLPTVDDAILATACALATRAEPPRCAATATGSGAV